jgi:hypothetical protein
VRAGSLCFGTTDVEHSERSHSLFTAGLLGALPSGVQSRMPCRGGGADPFEGGLRAHRRTLPPRTEFPHILSAPRWGSNPPRAGGPGSSRPVRTRPVAAFGRWGSTTTSSRREPVGSNHSFKLDRAWEPVGSNHNFKLVVHSNGSCGHPYVVLSARRLRLAAGGPRRDPGRSSAGPGVVLVVEQGVGDRGLSAVVGMVGLRERRSGR